MIKEKYVKNSEKDKAEHKDKTIISDDAYAIAEIIEENFKLIKRILLR